MFESNVLPNYAELLPAYGRDYKTGKAVKSDWEANKDFRIAATGQLVNKEQVEKGKTVLLRYARQTKVTTCKC